MDSLGTAVSVALQYGVPVSSLVKKFTHQRFEPAGMTTNRDIPFAKSLVDYIFRWMGMQFIDGNREENAPKRPRPEKSSNKASADRTSTSRISLDDTQQPATSVADRPRLTDTTPTTGEPSKSRVTTTSAQSREEVRTVVANGEPIASDMVGGSGLEAGSVTATAMAGGLNDAMRDAQADAPACDECGTITVRNGTCYRCLNCGHSMGCS
jgi:ribonucleoside-diphosphate reductase alpha chain